MRTLDELRAEARRAQRSMMGHHEDDTELYYDMGVYAALAWMLGPTDEVWKELLPDVLPGADNAK